MGSPDELRARARDLFTNWRASDAPLPRKLVLALRNRARALARGCCGHPGQPGC